MVRRRHSLTGSYEKPANQIADRALRRQTALRAWTTSPYALIAAPYLLLRFAAWIGVSPKVYQDSADYLRYAAKPFFSQEFWAGGRAWVPVLFYRLAPDGNTYRSLGQLLVSIACWLALAIVVARCIRRPGLRLVAFGLVLTFSMSMTIIQWDAVMVSESLSISLGAALVAAWLALVRRPGNLNIALVLLFSLLWASTRDTNSWVVLLTAPCTLAWLVIAWRRAGRVTAGFTLGRVALALGCIAIYYSVVVESTNGPIYRGSEVLFHVIDRRVVKDPAEFRYFRDHGLPPRQKEYRPRNYVEWGRHHARSTLAGFLITHPQKAIRAVVRDRDQVIDVSYLVHYRSRQARTILPEPLAELAFPPSFESVLFWLVVIGVAAAYVARRHGAWRIWLVPVLLLAFQPIHAFVVYHGDAWEVSRHSLLVGVLTRLSVLLVALFALDALLSRRGAGGTGVSPTGAR
jgi:hypothetical protein